jgi:HD superfamily phosphohydrolase
MALRTNASIMLLAAGHGPFSHTFERFVQSSTPSRETMEFKHEHVSLALIESLMSGAAMTNQEHLKRIINELVNRGVCFDAWIGRNDHLRLDLKSKDLQFIKDLVDPPKQFEEEVTFIDNLNLYLRDNKKNKMFQF